MLHVKCKQCALEMRVERWEDAGRILMSHHKSQHAEKRAPTGEEVWHRRHPYLHDDYYGNILNPKSVA